MNARDALARAIAAAQQAEAITHDQPVDHRFLQDYAQLAQAWAAIADQLGQVQVREGDMFEALTKIRDLATHSVPSYDVLAKIRDTAKWGLGEDEGGDGGDDCPSCVQLGGDGGDEDPAVRTAYEDATWD